MPEIIEPQFLVIDLFAGFGGTSTGFEMADGVAKVIAAVNHDPKAIKSHWINHPHVKHYEEDIRTLELSGLVALVNKWRGIYPNAKVILWASLECTNFSKAKGGQPRDADSRTLAESLYMHYDPATHTYSMGDSYIQLLNPDYIMIENVVEFMCWGPLDECGKPVSRRNGADWLRWRREVCELGYRDEWREMNSANYGAYTSRNRLFGCFAKDGLPIAWPEPTHAKNVSKGGMYGDLQPWKPVKDVLDFADEGQSIFGRKKPLSEKTLERIYAGLIKFVAGGKDNFLAKIYAVASNSHGTYSTDSAAHTITTRDAHALVQPAFISKYYSGRPDGKNITIDGPAGTITTIDSQALVQPQFMVQRNGGEPGSKVTSVEQPARTITATGGNLQVVQTSFLTHYYGQGGQYSPITSPSPVITTKARTALVQPKYLVNYHHSSDVDGVDKPCPTLTTRDKLAIVHPVPFIYRDFTGGGQTSSIEQPAGTVMPSPKMSLVQPFILNPSHGGHSTGTDNPAPVIVARQDKAPLYLVMTENGQWAIEIYDTDSEMTRKIKEFMAMYAIADIKMRMLKVAELLKIQGFPDGYRFHESCTQADMKKQIGNSVEPHVVQKWALAMANKITELHQSRA